MFLNKLFGNSDAQNDALHHSASEKKVEHNAELSAFMLSHTPQVIVDEQGLILKTNQAFNTFTTHNKHHLNALFPGNFESPALNTPIAQLFGQVVSLENMGNGQTISKNAQKEGFSLTLTVTKFKENGSGGLIELIETTEDMHNKTVLHAMHRSQAIIEFSPDGIIKSANENFLKTIGYDLNEIKGQHHKMFAPLELRDSPEYQQFWRNLREGKFFTAEIKRLGKGEKEIWLSASYNPLFNEAGEVVGVIKFATDITEQKLKTIDYRGQIKAINRAQAVIEFNMDGTIIKANEHFLAATGYSMSEIEGKHHKIFVTPEYAKSQEYKALWSNLNAGTFFSDEIERVAKDGTRLWLQASYNPIFDLNGKPYKVVKYATDVTERKQTIEQIKSLISKMTDGDLTGALTLEKENEFYDVAQALNSFITNIRNVMIQIISSSQRTYESASEISQANNDLAGRTELQVNSLREAVDTMQSLSDMITANSGNANQANRLSTDASSIASTGGKLIAEVVSTMGSITESAKKISEIIDVIDGIAFQTNILALNAAVEAARAGEQGRGFAVVASEVRTLAQRSANAAKDIAGLISDSVSKIENGNELVTQSGDTMGKIVKSIKEVTTVIAEIDSASEEQAKGIQNISASIKEIDNMTHKNVTMTEEAAVTSDNMKGQSQALNDLVTGFKLS
ncbi:methyl-accepting chemotaxis protein [Agaribacter flavus]|uniref:Methyl-accepting chemotaxis protein n=1 Tax=Agaribacter flavus TaxID=1902781 RepID=A0ABV7FN33_9ALTE